VSPTKAATKTAGYSGKPLATKLGVAAGMTVHFSRAPAGYLGATLELPAVKQVARPSAGLDFAQAFVVRRVELADAFAKIGPKLAPAGMLWISWPKKTSPAWVELDENIVREVGLAAGLVDVKVCAVDHDWSGLKFVRRKGDR
jgi:hypothetical protein